MGLKLDGRVRGRIFGIVLLAALLAFSILWAIGKSRRGSADAPNNNGSESPPATAVLAPLAEGGSERTPRVGLDASAGPGVPNDTTLRGTILIVEANEMVRPNRGTLFWNIQQGGTASAEVRSSVNEGHWKLTCKADARITPHRLTTFQGREAVARPVTLVASEANGAEILGDWQAGTLLRVLDPETMVDVAGVEMYCASQIQGLPSDPDTPPQQRLDLPPDVRGDSPVELPALVGTDVAWIRAPDRVWRRIVFSGSVGTRTVFLPRSGSIRFVTGGGSSDADSPTLFLMTRGGQVVRGKYPLGGQSDFTVSDLTPGAYHWAVIERSSRAPHFLAARQPCAVRGGETTVVHLDAEYEARGGQISVQFSDPVQNFDAAVQSITLRPLGDAGDQVQEVRGSQFTLSPGSATAREWRSGTLMPGDYSIEVCPAFQSKQVHVAAGETSRVEFELVDLAEVLISVVDQRNGIRPQDAYVRFGPKSWTDHKSYSSIQYSPGRGAYWGRAPLGEYTLDISFGVGRQTGVLVVSDPVNEVTIPIVAKPRANSTIRLECFEGEAEFPLDVEVWSRIRVRPVDGGEPEYVQILPRSQVGGRTSSGSSGFDLSVVAPGAFVLFIPPVPGYRQVSEAQVDCVVGGVTEVAVQWVPEP